MSIGALVSITTFASIPILTRKFSEVKVMVWGGFLFMVLGRVSFIPFGGDFPQIYDANFKLNLTLYCDRVFKNEAKNLDLDLLNRTLHNYGKWIDLNETNEAIVKNMTLNCGENLLGCPSNQEWCYYIPKMTLSQFLIGFFLTSLGYPIGVTLIQTIFSKLLGSKPQVIIIFCLYFISAHTKAKLSSLVTFTKTNTTSSGFP